MKTLTTTLLLWMALVAAAQTPKTDKQNKTNPPGTLWLRDSLYMDKNEVRNVDYVEYLTWLLKNSPATYNAALPDTTVWRDKSTYNEPYTQYYLRHPAYREYPVVGVSYEQAQAFCLWRTERVKELKKPIAGNIAYRLPNKEEWEYAANARNSGTGYGFDRLVDKNNNPKIWVKEACILFFEKGNDIYEPETTVYANNAGYCHMLGNVAEMIATKGVSKGGSVFNILYECTADKEQSYSKPTASLGFRCVCVVK